MRPTDELVREHEVIREVLEKASIEVMHMRGTGAARILLLKKMLDFFRGFADACHHAKEEKQLFPLLESRGMSHESGPIAVMLLEHEEGRKRLAAIADSLGPAEKGDCSAVSVIADNLAAYVELLENHIAKENGVLFPMAERILTDKDKEDLKKAFDRIEETETGPGVHERYHRLAQEIVEHA